jgi:hypothetical protein
LRLIFSDESETQIVANNLDSKERKKERWMDGWMDGWVGGWMDGWMDGWTGRQMVRWMDGWRGGGGRKGSPKRLRGNLFSKAPLKEKVQCT